MQEHNLRMKKAAEEFGAKLVIQGECGHGWRAARMYTNGLNGPVPFRLLHIHEYCDENLAKLPLKKLPLKVALHDPCNYARGGRHYRTAATNPAGLCDGTGGIVA